MSMCLAYVFGSVCPISGREKCEGEKRIQLNLLLATNPGFGIPSGGRTGTDTLLAGDPAFAYTYVTDESICIHSS